MTDDRQNSHQLPGVHYTQTEMLVAGMMHCNGLELDRIVDRTGYSLTSNFTKIGHFRKALHS